MPYSASHLSRTLKVKRCERGWNQDDLAAVSKVSKGAIARYEMEENTPGFDTMVKLADALGCSLDDFVPPAKAGSAEGKGAADDA